VYTMIVETPKGAYIKRNEEGSIDLVSPFSCPFNYGRVLGYDGRDGDPLDAILLGSVQTYNSRHKVPLVGVVRFVDGGKEDHKLIFSFSPPTKEQEKKLHTFFHWYARIKNLTRLLHIRDCRSRFLGIEWGTIELSDYIRR
jgi:inorganic pyrophosphatase